MPEFFLSSTFYRNSLVLCFDFLPSERLKNFKFTTSRVSDADSTNYPRLRIAASCHFRRDPPYIVSNTFLPFHVTISAAALLFKFLPPPPPPNCLSGSALNESLSFRFSDRLVTHELRNFAISNTLMPLMSNI